MTGLFEPRRSLAVALLATIVLCFLPLNLIKWESWFGRLAQVVVVPVSGPLSTVSRWLSPASKSAERSAEVQALEQQLSELRTRTLQLQRENDSLRKALGEIRVLMDLAPDSTVRQVYAPVVGAAGDAGAGLLTVKAGARHGVDANSIATGVGMQLVGRVTSVGDRTSTVLPITSGDEQLLAVVFVEGAGSEGLACRLRPRGDGTLRGPVEDRRDVQTAGVIAPKVGDEVRLADPERWPRVAQMVLIGRVEKIESAPEQALRKIITVRPTIERLDRVAQVIIRTGVDGEQAGGGAP